MPWTSRTRRFCGLRLAAVLLLLAACGTSAGCLFPKKQAAQPYRGLTEKESERLAALNTPDLPKPKRTPPEMELSPDNLIAEGDIYLQTGQLEGSLINYTRVLAQDPNRFDVRYKLGVVLMLAGQLDAAKRELAAVLAHQEMTAAHEALGMVFLQEGNYPEAERELRLVLEADPQRARTHYLLGVTKLKANDTGQAVMHLKTALAQEPQNVKFMTNLGRAYFQMKNYPEALRWLQKAQALNPDDAKIHQQVGATYAALKKYPEALEAYKKGGDEAQAYNNIGVQYYLDGRYVEAAKCFQRALELRKVFYREARDNLEKALKKLQEEGPNAG